MGLQRHVYARNKVQEVECVVEIDCWKFRVHMHANPERPTLIFCGDEQIELQPWTLAHHLGALARGLRHEAEQLTLDRQAFAEEVLRRVSSPVKTSSDAYQSLALWWAAGALTTAPQPQIRPQNLEAVYGRGWLKFGDLEVRLGPWTWAERTLATNEFGASDRLDTVAYIEAMLRISTRACRRVTEGGAVVTADTGAIWSLAGIHVLELLDAVLACNGLSDASTWMDEDPTRAAETLWICQTLGWTPGQVWAAPAHEIDRLLRLRAQTRQKPAPTAALPGDLASHPDAVVIHVEGV